MTTRTAKTSPLVRARVAGLLWFLYTATTFFSLGYVRPTLIILGDAAATAGNDFVV